MGKRLIRVIVGDDINGGETEYNKVLTYLWKKGAPGATVRRTSAADDDEGELHFRLNEDPRFDDLPFIVETVVSDRQAGYLLPGLGELIGRGQISVIEERNDSAMDGDYFKLKIFTKEPRGRFTKRQYEKILGFLRDNDVIWATATEATVGYGKDRSIQEKKVFKASRDVPTVIECLVPAADLDSILDRLKSIVKEGVVFTVPVNMVINK